MNFLRNNFFLVMMVVLTLVLGGGLYLWGMSISTTIEEEEMKTRERLASKIETLQRGKPVNIHTINAQTQRVEQIRDSLQQVRQDNLQWNTGEFSVPQLQTQTGKRPALPYDQLIWLRNELAFRYVQQYHKTLDALLAELNATQPPSEDEIETEAVNQQRILEHQERIRRKQEGTRSPAAPTGGPEGMPGMAMPGAPARRTGGGTGTNLSDQAQLRAVENLRLWKAQAGHIFANDGSFDVRFLRGSMPARLEPQKVWEAQVSVWVQQDLVKVLARTVQEAFEKQDLSDKSRNVLTSPIKRLVKIEVLGMMTGDIQESRGGRDAGPTGGPMGPEMGGYRRGGMSQPEVPATLTQHTPTKVYDVVNYRFTVLMPTRYLPALESNLMKANYHIILNEVVTTFGPSGSAGNRTSAEDLYYYGTEPYREVTLDMQFLLLASFTRGEYDPENETWIRPPLMPANVMRALGQTYPNALRQQDREYIEGRLPTPWRADTGGETSDARTTPTDR
jgi:hypothetical protein